MIATALQITLQNLVFGLLLACLIALLVCIPLLVHKERDSKEGEASIEPKKPEDWAWPRKDYK